MKSADTAGFGAAISATIGALATNPRAGLSVGAATTSSLVRIGTTAAQRAIGIDTDSVLARPAGDRRFEDPTWAGNPAYYATEQLHLLLRRSVEELIAAADVDELTRRKTAFAAGLALDSLAPTNFLLTNPTALKRAFETGGRSLVSGARNAVHDLATNRGRPTQVDNGPFTLGENLAATPGSVVYRNHLIEVIQYGPQTEQVHAVPILVTPPWINKYYVLDLAPGRSLVEWAVQHGRTVFMISFRNPDESMRELTMDDYLLHGVHAALDIVTEITGAAKVDLVGLCVGGLLSSLATAHHAKAGNDRINSLTLLNTMLDFSEPGILGCFTDPDSVDRLEERMQSRGYLDGGDMGLTFDLLRANDLIFGYVASSWLGGDSAPAMDILAWNADNTRMPQTMHLSYLRWFYGDNDFARGRLVLAGEQLRPSDIGTDVYIVAAENDHIVPWRSSYRTTGLASGEVRYVLSSGGHIAGVVNPPSTKAWFLTGDASTSDPDSWRASSAREAGSWWEDWIAWSAPRAGDLGPPPPMGSAAHPVLCAAPGEYVES